MLYQSQVHVNLMIRPNGYISVQTFTNRCVKCGLLHHEPQNGNGCKVPTIIRARVRGKCVQCMGVIEVHDLIARGPGSWMHASQAKQCVARALHPDPKEYVNPRVSRRPPHAMHVYRTAPRIDSRHLPRTHTSTLTERTSRRNAPPNACSRVADYQKCAEQHRTL